MNSQLYTAASGLLVEERRIELIANNLANLATPAFRAQRAFSALFQRLDGAAPENVRAANASVALAGTYEVPGRGPVRNTGRTLDVALEPDTYLVVSTAAGRRYTRAGNLQISSSGSLSDGPGHPILGRSEQPIAGLGPGSSLAADGRVLDGDDERGRLLVVKDPSGVLVREGDNLLTANGSDAKLETVEEPALETGFLEGSGTDAIGELVRLIEAQRAFESYQRLISATMNEVNKAAATQIAG